MTTVQTLRRLQAVDQEWSEKGRLFQMARDKLGDESELEVRRAAYERASQALAAERSALHDAELELAALTDKSRAVEKELYSDGLLSPRELENLRQESEHLKRRVAQLEEEVLNSMASVEEHERALAESERELRAFERAWHEERQALTAQYQTFRLRLKELKAEREQLRAALAPASLALYDELRAKKGVALAPLKDGVCQTCYVTLPWHKARSVEEGETIITCEGCGRILYQG